MVNILRHDSSFYYGPPCCSSPPLIYHFWFLLGMNSLEHLFSTKPNALYWWGMPIRSLHSSSPSTASPLNQAMIGIASVNHHTLKACVLKFVSVTHQSCPLSKLEKRRHTADYHNLSKVMAPFTRHCQYLLRYSDAYALSLLLLMWNPCLFWCL